MCVSQNHNNFSSESDLGFRYDWCTVLSVSDVTASGPADQILEKGDKIIKVCTCDVYVTVLALNPWTAILLLVVFCQESFSCTAEHSIDVVVIVARSITPTSAMRSHQ